jgi:hypothetical protein
MNKLIVLPIIFLWLNCYNQLQIPQKPLDEGCIFVIYLISDVTGLFFMPKIL